MKILYVYTSASLTETSVQSKVLNQIKYFNKVGVYCRGAFFSTDYKVNGQLNAYVDQIAVPLNNARYFTQHFQRRKLDKLLYLYIKKHAPYYDCIYFRYPGASKGLYKIVKDFKNIVFEINGNLKLTISKQFKTVSFKLSNLLHNINFYYIPKFKENYYGNKILKHVRCLVSVSNELAKITSLNYKTSSIPFIVVGNGIAVEDFVTRDYITNTNSANLTCLMLKGASTEADYLGFDRFLKGLAHYKGTKKIKVIAAGKQFKAEEELVKKLGIENLVDFVGYLDKNQIDSLINDGDVAIGTLATYRSNISEISSLKSREYYARGIPFIIGYTDTDLSYCDNAKQYIHEVVNDSSDINLDRFIEFCDKILIDKNHPLKMKKIAKNKLDFEAKIIKLFNGLEKYYV